MVINHYWPTSRRPWNYYVWHFNPTIRPWYSYGFAPYAVGYYPGYLEGYVYTGSWLCTGYDDVAEDHDGGHSFRSTDYNAAYDAALDACYSYHGESCVASCQREQ